MKCSWLADDSDLTATIVVILALDPSTLALQDSHKTAYGSLHVHFFVVTVARLNHPNEKL